MKKILGISFLWFFMLMFLENVAADTIAVDTIIAHWDFNSTANKIIPDRGRGSHHAVISDNSEAELSISPFDQALLINGNSTSVKVDHSEDLSLEDDFTIKCVIKPFIISGYNTILFKGDRKVKPNIINYWLDFKDGKLELKTKTTDDEWHTWISSVPVIQKDKWHKIVLSYKNGIIKLWVNGSECQVSQPAPFNGGKLIKNNYPLYIGQGRDGFNEMHYPFVGLIDDIKIIKGAVDMVQQSEKDEWNNRLVVFEKRETEDRANKFIARIEAARIKFSVSAIDAGKIKATLGDVTALPADRIEQGYTALEKEFNDILLKSYYKKYSKNTSGFLVTTLESSKRIERREDFINFLPPVSDQVKLQAAGNEYEGFQALLIANPEKDITNIQIKISDLVHTSGKITINSKHITFGRIKDIVSTTPDIVVEFTGAIPDMIEDDLLPQIIPKSNFVPVYFRVNVPTETLAGIYNGTITFTGNKLTKTINLQLRVFDFSLPKRSSLKMAYSFFEKFYEDWYDYKPLSDKQKIYIYDYLLKYRISPNNIYDSSVTYPEMKYLEKLKERINFFTFSSGGPEIPLSEKDLGKVINEKVSVYDQIKAKGLEQFAYFYSYDEIVSHPKPLLAARQALPALREKLPHLKAMQTSFPTKEIKDLFNVWSPLLYHFGNEEDLKVLKELKQRGDEIWWYTADSPSKPYPNYFLDYPVFNLRIIGTLGFMYNIDGMLYWCINREWATNLDIRKQWPQEPWKPYIINTFTKKKIFKNGMGNFVYPGPSGRLYPSLRLENLRDGVEDYEYLVILRNSIESLKTSNLLCKKKLIDEATVLLQVPSSVAVAVNSYSSDPGNLLKYRTDVAEMIEKIKIDEK